MSFVFLGVSFSSSSLALDTRYRQRWSSFSVQGGDRKGGRFQADYHITQEVVCLVLAYLCLQLAMTLAAV